MSEPAEPNASRKRALRIVIAVLLLGAGAGIFVATTPPSAMSIAQGTTLDRDAGTVTHGEITYRLDLAEEPSSFEGHLRAWNRAYISYAPFLTADLLLTTGDFSDPDLVKISWSDGHGSWRAKTQPKGSLLALHVIPANAGVQAILDGLEVWDHIKVTGYRELDGKIEGADGSYRRVNNTNHIFVVATAVERTPPPDASGSDDASDEAE